MQTALATNRVLTERLHAMESELAHARAERSELVAQSELKARLVTQSKFSLASGLASLSATVAAAAVVVLAVRRHRA